MDRGAGALDLANHRLDGVRSMDVPAGTARGGRAGPTLGRIRGNVRASDVRQPDECSASLRVPAGTSTTYWANSICGRLGAVPGDVFAARSVRRIARNAGKRTLAAGADDEEDPQSASSGQDLPRVV